MKCKIENCVKEIVEGTRFCLEHRNNEEEKDLKTDNPN